MDVWAVVFEALEFLPISFPPLLPVAVFLSSAYPLFRLYLNGFRCYQSANASSLINQVGATDTVCLLEVELLLSTFFFHSNFTN